MNRSVSKSLGIIYHIPSLDTIYAYRTIYHGFKHAFEDLGYEFHTYTATDNLEEMLERVNPNIFMTASHFYWKKDLNLKLLKKYRDKGMVMFTKIDFWDSPLNKGRINEAKSLKDDKETVQQIKDGLLGDIFYHVVEQGDKRMVGFEKVTGQKFYTIPLAADKLALKNDFRKKFEADISFIGTYLPQKRKFFEEYVFPLRKKYDLKLYGQDWTVKDRMLGMVQRGGQYFNIPYLKSFIKPQLSLGDEGRVYASSTISINVHEDYQRMFGGDCNERTFKIPLGNGFEITDDVSCIRKYFVEGKEIVIAKDSKDWFNKIDYYIRHPEEREKIIAAGKKRVLKDHTYHNRVDQIIDMYKQYGK